MHFSPSSQGTSSGTVRGIGSISVSCLGDSPVTSVRTRPMIFPATWCGICSLRIFFSYPAILHCSAISGYRTWTSQ
eukprot:Skav219126  [mRNA]  locus=scaffold1574:521822:531584:- [translate_table: standard]